MQTLEQVERSKNSLTLDQLAILPKRDKDRFVSSFTREQQHFFRQYLYEGQQVARSWDSEPISINPAASQMNDRQLGFGTPVLRARLDLVSTQRGHLKGCNAGCKRTASRRESSKENERPSGPSEKLPDVAKHDLKLKVGWKKKHVSRDGKKRSKEHNLRSSDNELVERRADRRQRKKTKRDIMNPEFPGDSDNEDKPSTISKVRKQSKRQSKVRQEFALMHGFSSTNVGKNRLTLKPGRRDVGVFQKGRASGKTEVKVRKRKGQESGFIFSEAAFLSKPCRNMGKIGSEKMAKISTPMEEGSLVASSVSASTTKTRTDSDMVKVRSKKFKDSKVPSKSNLVSKTKSQNQDKPQTAYNPADSVVWDIEQAESLGSNVSSAMKQGTIVLKLDHMPLTSKELLGNKAVDTNITTLEAYVKSSQQISLCVTQSDTPSSPSLGPSQSASQTGLKTVDMASLPTAPSKYFQPLPPRLAEPHLALTCHSVCRLDAKPSALSELGELSIVEDALPQIPEPPSHLHSSPFSRSYCSSQEGRPNFIPPVQPNYEVSVYEGYLDSEFWSPVNHPADHDLDVERSDTDDKDDVSVKLGGQINPSVLFPADDEMCPLDYFTGGELCGMDHTPFTPLFEHGSTELHDSISQLSWPGDAYDKDSETCQRVIYQDSGSTFVPVDLGSEDRQTQHDGNFNPEHEGSSMDLEFYPDVVHHFWQGHSLLYGLSTSGESSSLHKLSNVEADVARQLQLDHWQPQKL